MRPSSALVWFALTLPLSGQATAQNPYQQALVVLDENAQAFVRGQGHVAVDPESLTGERYYSEENFPGVRNRQAISMPDADLDPLTRAILILETQEASLPHARYRVTYSMDSSVDMPEAQQAYVDITRYNAGPSRRADLLMSMTDGQVADPAEFGVGPPVSSPQLEPAVFVDTPSWGVSAAARGMQEVWENIAADGMEPLSYSPAQPQFVFVISSNVAGQEAALSILTRQSAIMDHAVSEIWTQRLEVAGVPPSFSTLLVPRR